jgi:CDP-diacylglycerol--glycerol-3-phosphate 3-phosphatidyltransferase
MNDTSEIAKTESSRSLLAAVIQFVPAALVILRFFMGPLLLLNAINGKTDAWFIVGFIVAFLSDIFDGVIARRLDVSTASLRRADSWADVCLSVDRKLLRSLCDRYL